MPANEQFTNGVMGYEAEQNNEKSGRKRFFALRLLDVSWSIENMSVELLLPL